MRFLPLDRVEELLAEHPALLCAVRDLAAPALRVLYVEDVLPLGSAVYVHVLRDEKLYPVCGACEGAKTFDVLHRDGTTRPLPCAACSGQGKLYSSATREVVDVLRAEVGAIRYDQGCPEGYMFKPELAYPPQVLYRVRTATLKDAWWVSRPGPAQGEPAPSISVHPSRTFRFSLDKNLFWCDRKAAQEHADTLNSMLRERYDKENR